MPSMAEELATDLNTIRSRLAGSSRYGLATVSFAFIPSIIASNAQRILGHARRQPSLRLPIPAGQGEKTVGCFDERLRSAGREIDFAASCADEGADAGVLA